MRTEIAQSVQRLATGWTVRRSNPGGWGRDSPRLSRPALAPTQPPVQCVPGLSLPGVKRPERDVDHPPPSSAEVKTKSGAIPLRPLWAFVACNTTNSTSTFVRLHCNFTSTSFQQNLYNLNHMSNKSELTSDILCRKFASASCVTAGVMMESIYLQACPYDRYVR